MPADLYPRWMLQVTIGDYALALFYAQFGKIGFIDEVMCAYRKHSGGIWALRDSLSQRTVLARDLRLVARHMRWRYRRSLESQAAQALLKIARTHLASGTIHDARRALWSILPVAYCLPRLPWRRFVLTVLDAYAPRAVPVLRRVKHLVLHLAPAGRPPK